MKRAISAYCRLLILVGVCLLVTMLFLVFGNVVLRYGFNSGIVVSEELSRWMFVWLTFIGAIVALQERAHLGTDMLVGRLPRRGRLVLLAVSQLVMIYVTWLLLQGSWQQAQLNVDVSAPVTGLPVAVFYASGVVFSVSALLILAYGFWRLVTGNLSEEETVMVRESEEDIPPSELVSSDLRATRGNLK